MDELWDDYLQYLLWRCNLQKKTEYSRLFEILHHINFDYIIERDENREEDGIYLREDYKIPNDFYSDLHEPFYCQKCSVLEMLIALAIRVDDEFIGDPSESHPEIFFMEMIKNLGLINFKKNHYKDDEVLFIIYQWMHRKFSCYGRGSPFPVKYDIRDQRKLEIWDQMISYINEKYG